MELKINKKWKDYLFPLTTTELEQLEANILQDGIKDPITINMDGFILDGHNRYTIAKKHNLEFQTTILDLTSDDDVFQWMDKRQLGRRNLTDFQRDIIIGRMFHSIKNKPGNPGQNSTGERSIDKLSKTTGLSSGTIGRAAKTYVELEIIKDKDGDLYNKLVNEEVKINKNDISVISSNIEIVKEAIERGDNIKNIKSIVKKEIANKLVIDSIDIEIGSKIENMDAIEFLKSLPDNSVNLVLTDPPFGVDFVATRNVGNQKFEDGEEYTFNLLEETCKELVRVVAPNSHLYFFSGYTHLAKFQEIIGKYFELQENPLVWVKNNHTMCNFSERWANKYEFILFAKKGKRPLNYNVSPDILEFDKPTGKIHDCEKPIDLLQYIINNSSMPSEVVLDPFGGSLSTYRAAVDSGRKCFTCEKDETIYKIAVNNLNDIKMIS